MKTRKTIILPLALLICLALAIHVAAVDTKVYTDEFIKITNVVSVGTGQYTVDVGEHPEENWPEIVCIAPAEITLDVSRMELTEYAPLGTYWQERSSSTDGKITFNQSGIYVINYFYDEVYYQCYYINVTEGNSTPEVGEVKSDISVVLSSQNLTVDGKNVDCEKYNINGSNYFKLRDLAQLLNGTDSQFGVGYDAETSTVTITTGKSYESTGSELVTGVDNSATAKTTSQTILIDDTQHSELTVYNIGGSNFFQLRELGNVLDFEVDFDQDSNTAIVRGNKTAESEGQEQQPQLNNTNPHTTPEGQKVLDELKEADPSFYIDEDGMYHTSFANHSEHIKIQ